MNTKTIFISTARARAALAPSSPRPPGTTGEAFKGAA